VLARRRFGERPNEAASDLAVRAEHLGEALFALDHCPSRRRVRLGAKACFDLLVERVSKLEVEERAQCGEHDRHRDCKREAEANADRQPAHPSVRSR
jgi:hypothetical protein